MDSSRISGVMELHMRMMKDPISRQRMMADSAMRRMMREMMSGLPAEHRQRMQKMRQTTSVEPPRRARDTVPPGRPALPKPAPADTTGHDHWTPSVKERPHCQEWMIR